MKTVQDDIELERYELREAARYRFEMDRRDFFRVTGGGILVCCLIESALAQESGRRGQRGGGGRPMEISAWLHVGEDGIVTAYTGKTEVGQNIRTSLSQAVAEELRLPVSSVRMVMADTDVTPFDRGTFGSRTTPDMARHLHLMAAAAREASLDLASEALGTSRDKLNIEDGKVFETDGAKSASFSELTKGKELMRSVEDDAPVTPPERWKVAGKSVAKVDGRDMVTGKHQYTPDISRPGMAHGKILRAPAYNARLRSVDLSKAKAMPNVTVVRDGDFIGAVAPTEQEAEKAIEAIDAEWDTESQPSNNELYELLREGANPPKQGLEAENGGHRLGRSYNIAYIAHAPLEPRAAVAEWDDGKVTVWTGTQRPFGVRDELREAFRLGEDRVRVIVPDTGSGYGGKHTGEAAVEAARLAKEAGKPVKLVWTRQEEFIWAYFRPAGVIDISSSIDGQGKLTSWECHNYNSGGSALRTPYEVPGERAESHRVNSPLRQGSYRGLASAANVFAREMHMDELAHAAELDPLEFRLRNLSNDRMRAVFEAAAERFGWADRKKMNGRGYGIGGGTEKGSYIAACAEVAANPSGGGIKVIRVVAAFECGAVVNPDQLKNQVEGSVMMGLGGALFEEIEFADGRIRNPRFSAYRVPRFSDIPALEIVLVDRKDLPSAGAGETPIVCIAPAIGNAIFDATGKRINALPMRT